MREILFRGKRKDNGEWVQGSYVYAHKYFWTGEAGYFIRNIYGENGVLIDRDTLGQFTGLTDKNGKKIFEGDIVKTDLMDVCLSRGKPHVVEFDNKFDCGFIFKWKSVTQSFGNVWKKSEVLEVIGNIHDNPELLEEQQC